MKKIYSRVAMYTSLVVLVGVLHMQALESQADQTQHILHEVEGMLMNMEDRDRIEAAGDSTIVDQ